MIVGVTMVIIDVPEMSYEKPLLTNLNGISMKTCMKNDLKLEYCEMHEDYIIFLFFAV